MGLNLYRLFNFPIIIIIALAVLEKVSNGASIVENDDLHLLPDNLQGSASESETTSDNRDGRQAKSKDVKPIECTVEGKVAINEECRKYFECTNVGELATVQSCPGKEKFHHQMRICTKMTSKECKQNMCRETLQKFPDPYSKNSYLSCENMVPEVVKCGKGQTFNLANYECQLTQEESVSEDDEDDNTEDNVDKKRASSA